MGGLCGAHLGHHSLDVSFKKPIQLSEISLKNMYCPAMRRKIQLGYCHCRYSNEKSEGRIGEASTGENEASPSSQSDKVSRKYIETSPFSQEVYFDTRYDSNS